MKSSFVAAVLLSLTSSAHALITFSSSQLDLTNTVGITYDSNLTGGSGFSGPGKSSDDIYVNYSPRFDYTRNAGLIHLNANAGINFLRYIDQTQLNSEDVSAGLTLSLAEAIRGAYNGTLSLTYSEGATVEPDINSRVRSNSLTFSAAGQAQLSRRMLLSGGTNYSLSERSGGSDSETIGANALWSLQDFLRGTALRVSYSYIYTHSDSSRFSPLSIDQTSHQITTGLSRPLFPHREATIFADVGYRFLERSQEEKNAGLTGDGGVVFNVGVNGPFLPRDRFPKLTSSLNLSYSQATSPGLNDDDSRSLQGRVALDWQARFNTNVGVSLSRTRSLTVSNLSSESSNIELHVAQTLRYNLSATASGGYSWSTYAAPRINAAPGTVADTFYNASFAGKSRSDETFFFTTGLAYSFARVWTSNLRYEYRVVSSGQNFADYDHHLVSLNVSCRY